MRGLCSLLLNTLRESSLTGARLLGISIAIALRVCLLHYPEMTTSGDKSLQILYPDRGTDPC